MPFIGNLGPTELIIVLVIALLVLGPGKLPEVGSALGKSIREFRKAATDVKEAASIDVTTPAPTKTVTAAAPVVPAASAPIVDAPAPTADAPAEAPAGSGPAAPAS